LLNDTQRYVEQYQLALRALWRTVDPDEQLQKYAGRLAIGRCVIYPCKDGAAVVVFASESREIDVHIRDEVSWTLEEWQQRSGANQYIDNEGHECPTRITWFTRQLENPLRPIGGVQIGPSETGNYFSPKYDALLLFYYDIAPPSPDAAAFDAFQRNQIAANVAGKHANEVGTQDEQASYANARALLADYRALLDSARREEELQKFLKAHPELLYADYLEIYPKFKLGENLITDFVLRVRGKQGIEYVFIEIERPDKTLFVEKGHFHHHFTQADGQLTDWEQWIIHDHAYLARRLPLLFQPQFHLVIGRSSQLTNDLREKLQLHAKQSQRRYSTFDDVADHFEQTIERLISVPKIEKQAPSEDK
jgi:hypothetical protein